MAAILAQLGLTSLIPWIGGILAGVGALLALLFGWKLKQAGKQEQIGKDNQLVARTQVEIAQALVNAPRLDTEIEERLRNGKF